MIQSTADRETDSEEEEDEEDEEDADGGEAEIIGLAKKCLELLDEEADRPRYLREDDDDDEVEEEDQEKED